MTTDIRPKSQPQSKQPSFQLQAKRKRFPAAVSSSTATCRYPLVMLTLACPAASRTSAKVRPPAERVADERVTAVVNRQRLEPCGSQDLAGRAEALAKCVPRECLHSTAGNQRFEEWLVCLGAVPKAVYLPCREVFERPGVPPEPRGDRAPTQFDVVPGVSYRQSFDPIFRLRLRRGKMLRGFTTAFCRAACMTIVSCLPSSAFGAIVQTFHDPIGLNGDSFGFSIAAVGSNVLVGDYSVGNELGGAYLFDGATGALLRSFQAAPPVSTTFGVSVAGAGNYAIIGADSNFEPGSGAVYIFDVRNGALVETLQNPQNSYYFGRYVAASGGNILVGVPSDQGVGGAAYIYQGTNGSPTTTVSPSSIPGTLGNFCYSVAPFNNNILVSYSQRSGTMYVGHVGMFDGSTGMLIKDFQDPNPAAGGFPGGLAQMGPNIWAGADGAAYLLDGTSGALLMTLYDPEANASDGFGATLAVVGNDVVVGAPDGAAGNGAAYVFDSSGSLLTTLRQPSTDVNSGFGEALASFGNDVLVASNGTVYLFDLNAVPEPSTAVLLLLAVSCVSVYAAKRRRSLVHNLREAPVTEPSISQRSEEIPNGLAGHI